MATGDKLVNLEDLKAVYDNVAATESALDSRVNAVHCMVDYGLTPYDGLWRTSTGTRVIRNGTSLYIKADFTQGTYDNAVKLNGDLVFRSGNSTSATTFTPGLKLTVGHRYRLRVQVVSGTATIQPTAIWYGYQTYVRISGTTTINPSATDSYSDLTYTDALDTNGVIPAIVFPRSSANSLACTMQATIEDITTAGDANLAPVEGVTAASTHNSGDLVLSAGTLYKATANIAVGDPIASYATPTTVAAQLQANEAAITAEATARAAEDADIYMEPWQLMCKKYCITEGNSAFVVHRNHITFTADSSANAATLRTIVGAFAVRSSTLGNYTPIASELIPVSVFGSAIKMGFYVHSNTAGRNPRLAYKFCTVDGDTVTPVEDGYGTVPGTAANDVISEATVSVPNGATHVFFAITFSSGYYVGTYDMVYKIDKG